MVFILFLSGSSAALLLLGGEASAFDISRPDGPKYYHFFSPRAMAVDGAGHLKMVYGGDHLYYAFHDGVRWNHLTIDDSPGTGLFAPIATDGAGYSHVSYYDDVNGDLNYATDAGGTWDTMPIDTADNVGCVSSSYCAHPEGNCSGYGVCATKPPYCLPYGLTVCGCDGTTYGV